MLLSKGPRVQYTELEAANLLGVSVEELRTLVRRHIIKEDGEAGNLAYTSFHQSDLLLLKFLAGQNSEQQSAANAGL
jgi:hypothetical protein